MNKEIFNNTVESTPTFVCKNCGAQLYEAGLASSVQTNNDLSEEIHHVVCQNCGYIQTVSAVV